MYFLSSAEGVRFAEIATEMTERARQLGPNPLKDGQIPGSQPAESRKCCNKSNNRSIDQRSGATYVDARWYPFERETYLLMWNGNLKTNTSPARAAWGFVCYTRAPGGSRPRPTWVSWPRCLTGPRQCPDRLAAGHLPGTAGREEEAVQAEFTSPCEIDPFEVPLAEKVGVPEGAWTNVSTSQGVLQRIGDLFFIRKQIVFAGLGRQ